MNVKIELNSAGVRELLLSPEIMAACKEQAEEIVSRAGEGYGIDPYEGKGRVNVSIGAVSQEAVQRNYESNELLKALH